jgi:hypothetical protein
MLSMSFEVSSDINDGVDVDTNIDHGQTQEEWVEIIEPKSKTKIYANLQSGVCAKYPPKQSSVVKTDDFWWELFDKKTGKYYYYNPEQQKTSWAKPSSNGDGKRLLIVPVSKLKTLRKSSSSEQQNPKCDASTQTMAHGLISTGTQTISELDLENELNNKLRLVEIPSDLSKSSSCTHSQAVTKSLSPRSRMNHRQYSDFTGKPQNPYLKNYHKQVSIANDRPYINAHDQVDHYRKSSQRDRIRGEGSGSNSQDKKELISGVDSYFGPASTYHANRKSMHIQEPVSSFVGSLRRDELKLSTSTFESTPKSSNRVTNTKPSEHQEELTPVDINKEVNNTKLNNTQQMVTNNLSQYLVREARAMGIALISDDEIEDDDHESEDDCNLDEDEDTDLRDDLSSHQEGLSDLNASQELGEDSSEGWKSFSDHETPNGPKNHNNPSSASQSHKSPISNETPPPNSPSYNEIFDDQRDPAACKSQQLDHRKLVANFKKSRQTSALGFNESLGRSCKLDANQAVHRLKTVADSYFNSSDKDKSGDGRNFRYFSTLTTLPRPSKEARDRSTSVMQEDLAGEMDADYDVVEENCGYYSDSERLPVGGTTSKDLDMSKSTMLSAPTSKTHNDSSSPTSYFDRNKSTRGSTFSVESFARENLTRHPKGGLLFNRKVKWSRMISWTKNSIKQPMISSVSSDLSSDSIATFKLIQQFMGDRKVTLSKKYRQMLAQAGISEESYGSRKSLGRSNSLNVSRNSSAGASGSAASTQIPNRLRDELAYELCVKGCVKSSLRDEIFVQLARQLTDNPCQESTSWGLILMSILLSYFSPSNKFAPFLLAFLEGHPHTMARDVCLPRLEKRLHQSWFSYCRKPADGDEIAIVRLSITKWPQYCGVFGESLERIMNLQTCSPFLRTLRLPWILTTLGEKLIETGGFETEGLFRCAADHDLLAQLRLEIDCVDFRKITDAKQVKSLLSNVQDPHVIAGLLKLFFRQLQEPVFPSSIYDACLQSGQDGRVACRIFNEHLPNLNKDVVAYLIRLLQSLAESEKVTLTKMDTSNLSMVWAPNLLRAPEADKQLPLCANNGSVDEKGGSKWSIANTSDHLPPTSANTTTTSQSMIFEQTRQEMQFIKALITHLDTSFITNVL